MKFFALDGRYDVVCPGSLMGINYNEKVSVPVGFKEEYEMYSLDFEEFLWAKGYDDAMIEDLYEYMRDVKPFPKSILDKFFDLFREYIIVGGMPDIVNQYVRNNNFEGILKKQRLLLRMCEEDITKYAIALDKAKVKNVYDNISVFLAKHNKKFQISKLSHGARNREYAGTVDWLNDAGIVNICYCLDLPELPLKGNYDPMNYKLYFGDTGLLVASLDDEAQMDLRANKNFKGTVEMDFFVRDADSLIPVEVKANDNATASLNKLITDDRFPRYQIRHKTMLQEHRFQWKVLHIPVFPHVFAEAMD